MRSPGIGAQVSGMPTTIGAATTFTGTTTFNKTAETGVAEENARFGVSDSASVYFSIRNATVNAGTWASHLLSFTSTSLTPLTITSDNASDSGSNSLFTFRTRINGSSAATTRPIFDWVNGSNIVLSALPLNSGANLALSWGTQSAAAPAFTTRSAGTRAVWLSVVGASDVDYATGVEAGNLWNSIPRATNSYGYYWYGGTTRIMSLAGDGTLTLRPGGTTGFSVSPTGLVSVATVGGGFGVKEGSNATMGAATLVGGTVVVSTTKVTATSRIFLTSNTDGGTPGWVRVSARTAGTSFTITSSSGTDTSTVAWLIVEPQ